MPKIEAKWVWEDTGLRLHVKGDKQGVFYPYAYWRKKYGEVTVFPAVEGQSERLITIAENVTDELGAYAAFSKYLRENGYGD